MSCCTNVSHQHPMILAFSYVWLIKFNCYNTWYNDKVLFEFAQFWSSSPSEQHVRLWWSYMLFHNWLKSLHYYSIMFVTNVKTTKFNINFFMSNGNLDFSAYNSKVGFWCRMLAERDRKLWRCKSSSFMVKNFVPDMILAQN